MRRRKFIGLLGGAAAWPLLAQAQQPELIRRIGVLMVNGASDPDGQVRLAAFRRGLQELGWSEGRNLQISYRWGVGNAERAHTAVAELAAMEPDLILANGSTAVSAAVRTMSRTPIVFVVVTDPVGAGFVQSMSRPGGNITGFSTFEPEIGSKWLELLRETTPDLRRVAGLLDPGFAGFAGVWATIERMAAGLTLDVSTMRCARMPTIEPEVAALAQQARSGLIVLPTAINNLRRDEIISLAARHRLPAVYPFRHFATGGRLMAYGFDTPDLFRRSASYVDRVLKGERHADLPVQAPVKYEFVINFTRAKAHGFEIPPTLLARADEVIE